MSKWDELSMAEKAEMMKVAVRQDITNLSDIKQKYNEFAKGGNIYSGEEEGTLQMEVSRSPHIDLAISNPWLYQKLHPAQRKVEKYEPTTFAGRITQLAGASELGQKYADYTSSVIQQVPVVGLVPSALDLGYDTNRLYHNPSLTATKDVTLDAASLVPALRKTMKGWWMKGNSGSFITETGQIINNPRVASALEVVLQPFRTAINTGVYGARAADFLDDSKAYLKEMYNSSKIGKHFPIKALGGPLVEAAMNEYKHGGNIHIKPSHRGRLTELKKRTGKTEAELYNDGNPAHKKMVVFARNSRKWKHGLGGPLVYNPDEENIYGFGDWLEKSYNKAKSVVRKGRKIVKDLGLDKDPIQHFAEAIGIDSSKESMKNSNQNKNNNLGFWTTSALDAARAFGVNKKYKGKDTDTHYRQNLFNLVNPIDAVPFSVEDVLYYKKIADAAMSDKNYQYVREGKSDATADAAWAKRLGLPYDNTLLISNPDGSVHLSEQLENEIPTDTTFLKDRIASNERLLNNTYGKKRQVISRALDFDKEALDALRHTYKTGEKVGVNEHSHNSRQWKQGDNVDYDVTPLSLLHRYILQYDKDKNVMNYFDTYDFDEFEDFVPGSPFNIRGSINLNRMK